jgi:tight adherence protein C
MFILLLAAGLLSLGILILFVGVGLRLMAPDPLPRTLQQYGARPHSLEEIEMSRPFSQRVLTPLLRGIAGVIGRFTPQRNVAEMNHLLDVAGNPFNWTAADFLGLRVLSALLFAVLGFLYLRLLNVNDLVRLVLLFAAVGFGYSFPVYWLRFKANARRREITRALPDALDLLTISVEAGLGLDAAMQRVTQKWDDELSRAFARVLAEIRIGKLRRDALRDMANRMDVPDVSNLVAAIIQSEQLGASILNVMRIQSDQMRIVRRQRAQEKAQQAPLKMLIPLIVFIFPSMFIVIMGPGVLRLLAAGLLKR